MVNPFTRRKGARHGVYARSRPAVDVLHAASLAAAFAQVPRSAPRGQCDLSVAGDLGAGRCCAAWPTTARCWPSRSGAARQEATPAGTRSASPPGARPVNRRCSACFVSSTVMPLSARLSACFAPRATPATEEPAQQGVAIDGKAQRGRLRFAAQRLPVVHALSAFCHEQGIVLAHEPIAAGADKAEAELTVAPALLARIDWRGRVLTGDALFCQTALCAQVLAAGGDYLLLVKENQGTLYRDIQLLFDPPATGAGRPPDRPPRGAHRGERPWPQPGAARTRRLHRPRTTTSPGREPPKSFAWSGPGASTAKPKRTLRYGITSLLPGGGRCRPVADAAARPLEHRKPLASPQRRQFRRGCQPDPCRGKVRQ